MSVAKSIASLVVLVVVSAPAGAQFVQQALSWCGEAGSQDQVRCMAAAADRLCRPAAAHSQACFLDFERYHLAQARSAQDQRDALRLDTQRRIEALQRKAAGQ